MFFQKQLSCNVPGRSVTTLLPGGSCWGLVTVEEIVGGYLNPFSFFEGMCFGAGNDLWRGWTLAGALGFSVVITGRTRPRENGRREKKTKKSVDNSMLCFFIRDSDST